MIGLPWNRPKPRPKRPDTVETDSRRRPNRCRYHSLPACVEILEERVLLSATTVEADGMSHDDWRELTFTVDELTPSDGEFGAHVDWALEDPGVASEQSTDLIGLTEVFESTSYRGTGYAVVIIDTGIDYNHESLGGGWGNRVVAGYDFVNDDADPMDDHGHGTHVAGIVGSSHETYSGIAPDVDLIALKVLNSSGSGSFGDVEDALQWVIANQATYNIAAVNMSLGAGNYTSDPYSFMNDEFALLEAQGVFIAASSGNSFHSYGSAPGLGAPAISDGTVSVGAVWDANVGSVSWSSGARDYSTDADRITSFTQRSSALDILAPGAFVTNTYLGGGFATLGGTSMAAPVIAGAAALLHQALDDTGQSHLANQDDILALMQDTGVTVNDGDDEDDNVTNTGLDFKRLNLAAAMDAIVDVLPDFATLDGGTLDVYGTAGDDTFGFEVGSQFIVTLGEETLEFDPAEVTNINLHGGAGNDTLTITGSIGDEDLLLAVGSLTFSGTGFTMTAADIENVSAYSGGGADTAVLHDSAGDDRFYLRPTFTQITGDGFFHYVEEFSRVDVYVTVGGGDDRAFLFDSDGDDLLSAAPTEVTMSGTGFDNHAHDFDRLLAMGGSGGNDRADLYDSAADDRLVAKPDKARMKGDGYNNLAKDFIEVHAYASSGDDRASLGDSAGDDTLTATPTSLLLSGTGFSMEANGFDRAVVLGKSGGYDEAYLSDSAGDDHVSVDGKVRMSGADYNNLVRFFEFVRVTSSQGGTDTLGFDFFDEVFESIGDWILV